MSKMLNYMIIGLSYIPGVKLYDKMIILYSRCQLYDIRIILYPRCQVI